MNISAIHVAKCRVESRRSILEVFNIVRDIDMGLEANPRSLLKKVDN
jgi:hypothetical protein